MLRYSYKNLRPYLVAFVVLIAVGGFAMVAYRDFILPVQKPEVVGIVTTAPQQNPVSNPNNAPYFVPAFHPKYIKAQKINLYARVQPLELTKEGAIDAPKTAWDVGWYSDSALPGNGKGAVFIDGHVNDALNTPGVFYKLADLAKEDRVSIVRGDDTEIIYEIVSIERQSLGSIDMNKLLSSAIPGREGLTLVTCGGVYDKDQATFTERIIVYGVRQ